MKSKCFINSPKAILNQEHHDTAIYEIDLANLKRIRIMLVILFIVEVVFIVLNDIPYYFQLSTKPIWKDFGYFVIHILLLSTAIIGFILSNRLIKISKEKWKRSYSHFTPGIIIVYLILISLLNSLDLLHVANISSIFIANLLICGGFFMIKFPANLATFAIPSLCYMGSFVFLGFEEYVVYANGINCLIFLFAIVIISTTIYHHQYEGIIKNIILDQTNCQLDYISNHDQLTGLINRRCFMEKIENTQERKLEQSVVLLMDVDFFKTVNDNYGHPVGDIILKEIGSVLRMHIKEEDMAVRWGGEEFLLFLFDTTAEEAYIIAELIRKMIEEMIIKVNGLEIHTTASFGIASINNKKMMFSGAYKAADKALYQAKAKGRNCVVKADA